ncbi:carboxylating nicotinate-nucleotide diphosphorylase [bacterium]|nr:carboxylating nicotinate-nucleotide diphosphorylase [bacterium]
MKKPIYYTLIKQALHEDNAHRDITTEASFGKKPPLADGYLVAKQDFVLSGLDVARDTFLAVDKSIHFITGVENGAKILKGERFAKVVGPVDSLLRAERVALNFLQQLSGVATLTYEFVKKIKGSRAQILDTRKTVPGLRVLQKRAVAHGGGTNHRMTLNDMYLIKDNHIDASGSVLKALESAHAHRSKNKLKNVLIQIEARTLAEVKDALKGRADLILLDNMSIAQIKEAVRLVKGRVPLEVSGGVNINTVKKIASTGVSRISIGALTHSIKAVDISFLIQPL